ncbi:MAG: ATP-binding protein [Euryarchaeota archaeon]|nr:ATP-binding protein [Euryarchaeota archaeon]
MTDSRGSFNRQTAYSRLYEAMQTDRPLEARLKDALEIGVEQFGVDFGYLTEIDPETNDWEAVISTELPDGTSLTGLQEDLTNTFCLRTIRDEGIVAFADVTAEGLEDHPGAAEYGVHCYHGAPILVDNEPHGTVCFASYDPRAEAFSEAEKSFSHLVAQMAGYEIEQQEYEAELAERAAQLDERSEIYRAVIDASFEMVFRLDRDGEFTYASSSSVEAIGYTPEELDGESISLVHPNAEVSERAWELFERVLSGETIEEHYLPIETKSGELIYVDLRATPIYDSEVPDGERTPDDIVAIQAMSRDATDRKRRDGLISVINRVLRHNLRNDVGVISGYAEMLEDELEGQQQTLAKRVRTTSDRLLDLSETAQKLEETLDGPIEQQAIDLRALAERVADQLGGAYPDASITVSGPETAVVDSAPRLETAVWELVDNAAKHTGDLPSIEIRIDETESQYELSVQDDGPGLPELERSVLQSGEETPLVHGRGLGLWLVYWIVTGVDGTVTVTEPQRPGTTIELRLPKSE